METLRMTSMLSKMVGEAKFRVLVDYDPYGYEIALQYRIGSKLLYDRETTKCDAIQLLGVRQAQLDMIWAGKRSMTTREAEVCQRVMKKASSLEWGEIKTELRDMLDDGICAEIEALCIPNASNLVKVIHGCQ